MQPEECIAYAGLVTPTGSNKTIINNRHVQPERRIANAGLVVTPTVSNKTIINNGKVQPEECIMYAGLVVTPTVSNKTIINKSFI